MCKPWRDFQKQALPQTGVLTSDGKQLRAEALKISSYMSSMEL